MIIYGSLTSGNCQKVKFACDYLGLDYQWEKVSVLKKETKAEGFLQKNPFGQIPLLELDDGRLLSQSNAIIGYLAKGSDLIPKSDFAQAKMNQWLFWEQYSHEPCVAVLRFKRFIAKLPEDEVPQSLVDQSVKVLSLLDSELKGKSFLLGDAFSLADISLVAYSRMAGDADLDISKLDGLRAWIARCEEKLNIIS